MRTYAFISIMLVGVLVQAQVLLLCSITRKTAWREKNKCFTFSLPLQPKSLQYEDKRH